MTAKIQVRRDTTANWTTNSSVVINAGEIAYDTDLNQIKIGSGATWASTPWLGSTLPTILVTSTDLNDVSNRVQGRYQFTAAAGSPTNGPITFASGDGMIAVLVTSHGTSTNTLVQHLSTEGDGTSAFPPKHYVRLFDGGASAWRGWVSLNIWAVSSSEGVAVSAKTLESKDTLSVAGVSTLTGNVVLGGTVSVPTSTASAPAIFHTADSNTGIAFPSNDSVVITTSGTAALTVGSGGGVTLAGNLQVNGFLTGALNANTQKITNLGDPTTAQDAVTKSYLEANRVGQTALVAVLGGATATIPFQVVGIATSGFTIVSQQLRAPSGTTWKGIAATPAGFCGITVTDSAAPSITTTGQGDITNYGAGAFWHCTLIRTA